jgi:hypothetical protein
VTSTKEHSEQEATVAPAAAPRTLWQTLRAGIIWGILVFLAVLLAGGAYIATRQDQWTAQATTMVIPDPTLDATAAAAYYETLSRGQVVATVAEVLALQRFQIASADKLGLPSSQRSRVAVQIQMVPDTAIIQVLTTAPSARLAEEMADGVLAEASAYYDRAPDPFVLSTLSGAGGTAFRSGPPRMTFAAAVVLVALIAAVATQQGVYHLGLALRHGRRKP